MSIQPASVPQKRLKKIWSQVPANYYDQGIEKNILQKLWHTKKLNELLKLLPKDSRNVLDIGCSSAILTAEVAKSLPYAKVTGLDSYKAAIEFARKKYPHIHFVVADAHKLPFKNKSFDLIICTETLEHVIDPLLSLKEMRRVLKKNSFGIISMDSGSVLFRLIWYFWTKTKGKVWEDAHLHEFNDQLLHNLIKKAGFKIKKKKYSHLGMAVTFLVVAR